MDILQDAIKFVELLEKYEGSPGYPIYNWYLHNKHPKRSILVTVQYQNSMPNGQIWSENYTMAPNELRNVKNKTYDGVHFTFAKIQSAQFVT